MPPKATANKPKRKRQRKARTANVSSSSSSSSDSDSDSSSSSSSPSTKPRSKNDDVSLKPESKPSSSSSSSSSDSDSSSSSSSSAPSLKRGKRRTAHRSVEKESERSQPEKKLQSSNRADSRREFQITPEPESEEEDEDHDGFSSSSSSSSSSETDLDEDSTRSGHLKSLPPPQRPPQPTPPQLKGSSTSGGDGVKDVEGLRRSKSQRFELERRKRKELVEKRKEAFKSLWMRSVAEEFGDELDAIRTREPTLGAEGGTRLPLLIDALGSGCEIFSSTSSSKDGNGLGVGGRDQASRVDEVALAMDLS